MYNSILKINVSKDISGCHAILIYSFILHEKVLKSIKNLSKTYHLIFYFFLLFEVKALEHVRHVSMCGRQQLRHVCKQAHKHARYVGMCTRKHAKRDDT